jgi:hypothetical protein
LNIKPCMGQISGTWILKKKYDFWWKNSDLQRLKGRLKLRFLARIGQSHRNHDKKVAHFTWFGEPWSKSYIVWFTSNHSCQQSSLIHFIFIFLSFQIHNWSASFIWPIVGKNVYNFNSIHYWMETNLNIYKVKASHN